MYEKRLDHESADYQSRLNASLGVQLTPDNIDTYADQALEDLIGLTEQIAGDYTLQTGSALTGNELEDAAYTHFGLSSISGLLDHVQRLATSIQSLDEVIAQVPIVNKIITPPDYVEGFKVPSGDGNFEKPRTVPRLKTLLFVLAENYHLDITDRSKVSVLGGEVDPDMMRESTYYAVTIPSLNRTVLLCDELNNITIVFDRENLIQNDITDEELLDFSKKDLNDLINSSPCIGQYITYSEDYVSQLAASLADISDVHNSGKKFESRYLYPPAPEGILSCTGIADSYGMTSLTVKRVIDGLGTELGEAQTYRFGPNTAPGFNLNQQQLIRSKLEERGLFAEPAREGVLSANGVSKVLGVARLTVDGAIEALGDRLGETQKYKFGTKVATGFTPEQRDIIRDFIHSETILAVDPVPEGVLSVSGIARAFGVDHVTVQGIVKRLSDDLGDTQDYRFSNKVVPGYTDTQQSIILQQMENQGLLAPPAPEDIASTNQLAAMLEISANAVEGAVKKLGDILGDVGRYRFGPNIALGLNTEQQSLVQAYLENRGLFLDAAPDGVLSFTGIVKSSGYGDRAIKKVINDLGDSLGEVKGYRFGARVTFGYTPEQQQLIMNKLELEKE